MSCIFYKKVTFFWNPNDVKAAAYVFNLRFAQAGDRMKGPLPTWVPPKKREASV